MVTSKRMRFRVLGIVKALVLGSESAVLHKEKSWAAERWVQLSCRYGVGSAKR